MFINPNPHLWYIFVEMQLSDFVRLVGFDGWVSLRAASSNSFTSLSVKTNG